MAELHREIPIDISIHDPPRIVRRFFAKISHETVRRIPIEVETDQSHSHHHLEPNRLRHRLTFGPRQPVQSVTFHLGEKMSTNNGNPNVNPQRSKRLIEMLDHIEKRVEMLREQAVAIEQEKDSLLSMIGTIQTNKELKYISEDEKEEIELTAHRLLYRTLTVEVSVTTPRNECQAEALKRVTKYVDELAERLQADLSGAKCVCEKYLNACLPESTGAIDQKFQANIIECTAEDQKKIRKRLESLLKSIMHAQQMSV